VIKLNINPKINQNNDAFIKTLICPHDASDLRQPGENEIELNVMNDICQE